MRDFALYNSYLLLRDNSNMKVVDRKQFMKNLSESLAKENMVERYNNRYVYAQVKDSFLRFGMKPHNHEQAASESPQNPQKCQTCGCRKSIRSKCCKWQKFISSDHKLSVVKCLSYF